MDFCYCSIFLSFHISTLTLATHMLSIVCRQRRVRHHIFKFLRLKMAMLLGLCFIISFTTSYYWSVARALSRSEELDMMLLSPIVCPAWEL